ncbi:MAG TPA: NAD-binding protein [Methylovorus sp.]|nr:NAD-binding protein [Methylovorus sp.]
MNNILFLILRRMRLPIIAVIVSYTIAVAGMSLMPGVDPDGQPWRLSIFEAFYVISYTATTIGFGEVPFPYSTAQRMWMSFSIYLTVIPWFYAIGKIITLFQDPGLRQAFTTSRFAREVNHLMEPFYIVCGYGETGSLLVRALDKNEVRVVVIELEQERINELELEDYQFDIPNLCADAKLPETLLRAGLKNPMCQGVAALTNDDHANLAIAVAVKLISPELRVLGRAETEQTASNMASFGTDHIINPYTIFGDHLAMEVHAIGTYLLHEWLTGVPGESLKSPICPPIGKWIVCGYGRFGRSVVQNLELEHISTTIIEADPERTGCKECIVGNGTEKETLQQAGVHDAVGIVAGTNDDINNLSIVMTAREMNPDLFVVLRKNKRFNAALFEHFKADITMEPSDIIAHECLANMISPLLAQFLSLVRLQTNVWANSLIQRLVETVGENVPETWAISITQENTPALFHMLAHEPVTLADILRNPNHREASLAIVPLMILRNHQPLLLPEADIALERGDRILFCGHDNAKSTTTYALSDFKTMRYMLHDQQLADSWLWRQIKRRKSANNVRT